MSGARAVRTLEHPLGAVGELEPASRVVVRATVMVTAAHYG